MSLAERVRALLDDDSVEWEEEVEADVAALEARCAALTARLRELAESSHKNGERGHVGWSENFDDCDEPSCVADRALIGEGT